MANLETQVVDDIIVEGRRKMLAFGGTALAGLAVAGLSSARAAAQTTTAPAVGDLDILNFALNLEYLEANFYYLAAFGTTIDKPNAASIAAGGPSVGQALTGTGTQGTVVVKASPQVPFTTTQVASYAVETAIEEGKHVNFLYNTINKASAGAQAAQPQIDLLTSFNTLAAAAGIGPAFDPFLSDATFLIGAYVFEDVGVTAYHGAAPLISTTTSGKAYLQAAAGILAVEAYHAGLIRTTINFIDTTGVLKGYTQQISALRSTLSYQALGTTTPPTVAPKTPDDIGVRMQTVTLNGAAVPATTIVDADANVIAFSRNTTQVLNIVTGGGAVNGSAVVSPAKGVFFPAGLNGLIK